MASLCLASSCCPLLIEDPESMGSTRQNSCFSILIEELECPVCCQTPRNAPIFQCENGHLLCCSCKPKMAKCPQGRCSLTEHRSRIAENLLEKSNIPRPCKFSTVGCFHEDELKDLAVHELNCGFRKIQCPDFECVDHVLLKDLAAHLVQQHKLEIREVDSDKVAVDDCFWVVDETDFGERLTRRTWPLSVWKFQGNIFISTFIKERNSEIWTAWISVVGSDTISKSYRATIVARNKLNSESVEYRGKVHSVDVENNKIMCKHECLTLTDQIVERLMMGCPQLETGNEDYLRYLLRIQYHVEIIE